MLQGEWGRGAHRVAWVAGRRGWFTGRVIGFGGEGQLQEPIPCGSFTVQLKASRSVKHRNRLIPYASLPVRLKDSGKTEKQAIPSCNHVTRSHRFTAGIVILLPVLWVLIDFYGAISCWI